MQMLIELMNKGYIDDPDNRNKEDEVARSNLNFVK